MSYTDTQIAERVGRILHFYRLENRREMKDVARRARCSKTCISRWERGQVTDRALLFHRVCEAIGVSASWVMAAAESPDVVIPERVVKE